MAEPNKPVTVLPISPITLTCPFCNAKPGHDCATSAGGFSAIHVARIKAAAAMDAQDKRKREDFSQAAARIVREATEDK